MQDNIFIEDLKISTQIGVEDWEQSIKQQLYIDLFLYTDFTKSIETDDIENTVNYKKICDEIILFCSQQKNKLIETLANKISNLILTNNPKIDKLKLILRKKPLLPVKCTGVCIERKR